MSLSEKLWVTEETHGHMWSFWFYPGEALKRCLTENLPLQPQSVRKKRNCSIHTGWNLFAEWTVHGALYFYWTVLKDKILRSWSQHAWVLRMYQRRGILDGTLTIKINAQKSLGIGRQNIFLLYDLNSMMKFGPGQFNHKMKCNPLTISEEYILWSTWSRKNYQN